MIKSLLISLLLYSYAFNGNTQTKNDNNNFKCYKERIQWNIKENQFKDTVVLFRNYINNCDDKRVICDDIFFDKTLEKLIWDCKYLETYIKYQNKLNKYSFISYRKDKAGKSIVSFYLCDVKTKESTEMCRLKIDEYRIVGINILPCCFDGYTPIEEFDHPKEVPEM